MTPKWVGCAHWIVKQLKHQNQFTNVTKQIVTVAEATIFKTVYATMCTTFAEEKWDKIFVLQAADQILLNRHIFKCVIGLHKAICTILHFISTTKMYGFWCHEKWVSRKWIILSLLDWQKIKRSTDILQALFHSSYSVMTNVWVTFHWHQHLLLEVTCNSFS